MAIVFAICVLLFFALAALGVDLGNAMNRKKQLQTNADLAALAGGSLLPAPSTTPQSTDAIVQRVAEYLLENEVFDDDSGFGQPSKSLLAQKLVSTLAADQAQYGHVYYGHFDASGTFVASKNYVTVRAPSTKVSFGLASAVGFDSTQVSARATAALKSKSSGAATLPFYAYTGCDWGQQIISHGTANATTLDFYLDDETNGSTVNAPTSLAPNPNPSQVDKDDTATVLSVSGTNLTKSTNATTHQGSDTGVTALGLFLPDASAPEEIKIADFVSNSAGQISFSLPSTVAANDGAVYYVRVQAWVKKGSNWSKQWSATSTDMAHVEVGSATLFCNDDKSAGNFGSLSVFRMDSTNNASTGWLPLNIAVGLDEPEVKLNPYPNPIPSNACDNGDANAYQSDDTNSGVLVNCVVTDVGFPQNSATSGFLTNVSGTPGATGRLTSNTATTSGCGGSNGAPKLRTVDGNLINNEELSCFFTNSTVKVSDVSDDNYSGGVVLDPSIFGSPRFFSVPVINDQPANGKKSFPIVGFRYAFMTGENQTAYKGHGNAPQYYYDDSDTNGLVLSSDKWNSVKVESFRVVFIHPKAVPPPPGGGTPTDFDGVEGSLYLVD